LDTILIISIVSCFYVCYSIILMPCMLGCKHSNSSGYSLSIVLCVECMATWPCYPLHE
jgi:hypothetical protein